MSKILHDHSRLLHVAAGYSLESKLSLHRSGTLKRRLFVRALCRLLTTSATRHKALLNARKLLFAETYSNLLTHMEEVVVEGKSCSIVRKDRKKL